jgi:hypothetical protein
MCDGIKSSRGAASRYCAEEVTIPGFRTVFATIAMLVGVPAGVSIVFIHFEINTTLLLRSHQKFPVENEFLPCVTADSTMTFGVFRFLHELR